MYSPTTTAYEICVCVNTWTEMHSTVVHSAVSISFPTMHTNLYILQHCMYVYIYCTKLRGGDMHSKKGDRHASSFFLENKNSLCLLLVLLANEDHQNRAQFCHVKLSSRSCMDLHPVCMCATSPLQEDRTVLPLLAPQVLNGHHSSITGDEYR